MSLSQDRVTSAMRKSEKESASILVSTHGKRLSGMLVATVLACIGVVCSLVPNSARAQGTGAPPSPLVLIMLENEGITQVVGSKHADYLNCGGSYAAGSATPGFLCQGTEFKDYYSAQHPSLPNYLDLTSGGDDGCLSDVCPTESVAEPSLFGELGSAGYSFLSLVESMPTNCDTTSSGAYAARHNPEVYYLDVATTTGLPYDCAATDLAVADAFPNPDAWPNPLSAFSLITPNLCDDGHGAISKGTHQCAATTGPADNCQGLTGHTLLLCDEDNWLAVNVPTLLAQTPKPTVALVFDEGLNTSCADGAHACGGNVLGATVGPGVAVGADTSGPYTDFSLSRGIADYFGLPCLQDACAAAPITLVPGTADGTTPAQPGAIALTSASPGTIGLTWGAATDADGEPIAGYEVDRSADGGSTWTPMGPLGRPATAHPLNGGLVSTGTNSYTDSSASAGATYSYQVLAVDPHGHASSATVLSGVSVPSTYACPLASSALTLRQCTAARGTSTHATATLTRNITAGDFLVAVLAANGPSTTTFCATMKGAPSSWSAVISSPSGCTKANLNLTMYDRVNAPAQTCPCKVTFTLATAEDWTLWLGDYSGVATSSPLDGSAEGDSAQLPSAALSTGMTGATSNPADLAVAALWNDSSLPPLGPSVLPGSDTGAWTQVSVTAQGEGGSVEILQKVVTPSGVAVGAQDSLTGEARDRGIVAIFK